MAEKIFALGDGSTWIAGAVPLDASGNAVPPVPTITTITTIAALTITAGTPAVVWTPASGKRFRLMGWSLSISTAAAFIFKYGTVSNPTTMFRSELLAAAGISQSPPNFGAGTKPGGVNDPLLLDVTAGTPAVTGYVFGVEE